MALWTPAEITTALWLDASDAANYTLVSSAYSEILDKSGNSRMASQATSTRRPAHIAAGQNGLDFARFDGSDDQLNLVSFAQASGQTVILACDTTSLGASFRGFMERTSPVTGNLALLFGGNSALSLSYRPNVYWNNAANATAQPSAVQKKSLLQWGFESGSPSSAFTKLDAGTPVSATFTASALTNWLLIGGADTQNSAFDFYEAVMLPPEYTAAEVELVEGYLAWKWGLEANLPSGHPYELAAPEIAGGPSTNTVSGTVTLDATAADRTVFAMSAVTPFAAPAFATAPGGAFSLDLGAVTDDVLTVVLDDYGTRWAANTVYAIGARVRPTVGNDTGYVYEVTAGGDSGPTEPAWWVSGAGSIGAATATAIPMRLPYAHGPVTPISSGVVEELWTPAEITTALWLDAADAGTITEVSGAVSQWDDKSGNARHAAESTPSLRPVYDSVNDAIEFSTFTDQLIVPGWASGGLHNVFAVCDPSGGGPFEPILVAGSGLATSNLLIFAANADVGTSTGWFQGAWKRIAASTSGDQLLHWKLDSSTGQMFRNGTSLGTAAYSGLSMQNTVAIANWPNDASNATRGFRGKIYEVVHVTGEVDTTARQLIEGYLAWKWGLQASLPGGHPYEFGAPTVPSTGTARLLEDNTQRRLEDGTTRILEDEEVDVKVLIETITLGTAGEFDFAAIPGTYKRLIIQGFCRSSVSATADVAQIIFNADETSGNYHRQNAGAFDGANQVTEASANDGLPISGDTALSGAYSQFEIVVEGYAESSFIKSARVDLWQVRASRQVFRALPTIHNESITDPITRIRIRTDNHPTDGLIGTLHLYGEN